MVRYAHLYNDRVIYSEQGEVAIVPRDVYEGMVRKIERFADRLQVEVIYRELAERRLAELEGEDR